MSLDQLILAAKPDFSGNLVQGALFTPTDLAGVDDSMIETLIQDIVCVWDMKGLDLDKFIGLLEYEGFDPKNVYKHVLTVQKKHSLSDKEMTNELGMLLTLQHIKGNLTMQNFKSLKPEAQDVVSKLIVKWQIQLKAKDAKKFACTLPRLAAAFPLQVSIVANKVVKDFPGYYRSRELPHFMKTSCFPSIVPLGKAGEFLCAVYTCFACDQQTALQKVNYTVLDDKEIKQRFEDQAKYTEISYASAIIENDGRINCMRLLKVKNYYDQLAGVFDRIVSDRKDLWAISKSEWKTATFAW